MPTANCLPTTPTWNGTWACPGIGQRASCTPRPVAILAGAAAPACGPPIALTACRRPSTSAPVSPVGLEFGYGTKFPAKYQRALFALDWTFGTIYAVHLVADGASYTGTREEFLSRSPLPLTDAAVGPDGALYFTTGGRATQSELYRVTYVGNESTAPVDARDSRFAELRALRQKTEARLAPQEDPAEAATRLIGLLSHADRHIRYAARVSLERLPPQLWQERVLAADEPDCVIGGVVGLAHVVDSPAQPALLAALDRLDYRRLTVRQQLDFLRALSLVSSGSAPEPPVAARLAARFDAYYPTASDPLNRELCDLLVFLNAPTVVAKTLALVRQSSATVPAAPPETHEAHALARNPKFSTDILAMMAHPPDPQKIAFMFSLRNLAHRLDIGRSHFLFHLAPRRARKANGPDFSKVSGRSRTRRLRKHLRRRSAGPRRRRSAQTVESPQTSASRRPRPAVHGRLADCPLDGATGRPQFRRRPADLCGCPLRRLPPVRRRRRLDRSRPDASRRPIHAARSLRVVGRTE